jgi:hypothetical protein
MKAKTEPLVIASDTPTKHYKYGGSTAERTMECYAWHALAEQMPKQPGSVYAQTGTALHYMMELLLDGDFEKPSDFLGATVEGVVIGKDEVLLAQMALDAWDDLCREYDIDDYIVEQTYEYDEETGGTADVIAWSATVVLVVDWKFGQGIEVSPVQSKQGLFYSMIARNELYEEIFEGRDLSIAIIQPISSREDHDTLKIWDTEAIDMDNFISDYWSARKNKSKEFVAGKHCAFCPGEPICPEKTGMAHKAMRLDPEQADTLAEALALAVELKSWVTAVETFAHEQMELGTQVEGFKLVAKRATRKWVEAEDTKGVLSNVETMLRKKKALTVADIMQPPKLKTPPQMEKMLKQKGLTKKIDISDYIVSESSGTTIARESDKREAIISSSGLRQALSRIG